VLPIFKCFTLYELQFKSYMVRLIISMCTVSHKLSLLDIILKFNTVTIFIMVNT
jgi:hypothetical protein